MSLRTLDSELCKVSHVVTNLDKRYLAVGNPSGGISMASLGH